MFGVTVILMIFFLIEEGKVVEHTRFKSYGLQAAILIDDVIMLLTPLKCSEDETYGLSDYSIS